MLNMFAGIEQQCNVLQNVHDQEYVSLNVVVENDQTCFKEADVACSVTAYDRPGMTPQPVSIAVGHSTFNFTGFERCLQYLACCYILHEGYQPAVCEASIQEFISECLHTGMETVQQPQCVLPFCYNG